MNNNVIEMSGQFLDILDLHGPNINTLPIVTAKWHFTSGTGYRLPINIWRQPHFTIAALWHSGIMGELLFVRSIR